MKTFKNVKQSSLSGLRFCRRSLSGLFFGIKTCENVQLSSLSGFKGLRAPKRELQVKTLTDVKLSSLSGLRFCQWSLSGFLFGVKTIENVQLSSLSGSEALRAPKSSK